MANKLGAPAKGTELLKQLPIRGLVKVGDVERWPASSHRSKWAGTASQLLEAGVDGSGNPQNPRLTYSGTRHMVRCSSPLKTPGSSQKALREAGMASPMIQRQMTWWLLALDVRALLAAGAAAGWRGQCCNGAWVHQTDTPCGLITVLRKACQVHHQWQCPSLFANSQSEPAQLAHNRGSFPG